MRRLCCILLLLALVGCEKSIDADIYMSNPSTTEDSYDDEGGGDDGEDDGLGDDEGGEDCPGSDAPTDSNPVPITKRRPITPNDKLKRPRLTMELSSDGVITEFTIVTSTVNNGCE